MARGAGIARQQGAGDHPAAGQHWHVLAAAQKRVFNPVVQLAARKRPRIAIARIVEPSASCSCLASRVSNCTWSANVDIQCSHESQSGSQGRIAGAMAQSMLCGGRIVALSPQPALRAHRRLAQNPFCQPALQHRPAGVQSLRRRTAVLAITDSEQRSAARKKQRDVPAKASNSGSEDAETDNSNLQVISALVAVALIAGIGGGGYVYRDSIKEGISWFISVVDDLGPAGPVAYTFVYTVLELVIIPAIPLTMAAGALFGVAPGVVVVSLASTAAAALGFLITRYAARDKVAELAKDNKKFNAIDRAIGKDSFKVVLLLRLSPLLPLALSNYLYGLTSVDFVPYVLGSWLGMLPGTIAYVSAGSYGRKVMDGMEGGASVSSWQVAVGAAVTFLAIGYIGRIAKQALDEVDDDM